MGHPTSALFTRGKIPLLIGAGAVLGALAAVAPLLAQQPTIPTSNVNVIAGTGPDGDWTLQRQNEPAGACSSRNPLNCMVGANDYRTVDIPFPDDANRVIGDAWLGWYTTKDGGLTWRTRLLPGYPQDLSPQGLASPLKGMQAGADPVVRSGANGMFFYAGIAFVRGAGGASRLFVARFIDNNDRERPDVESIQYIDTTVIQSAPQGTVGNFFVDKPWIAVDIPRDGARRCRIGGRKSAVERQLVPCARVYVAYTVFMGTAPTQSGVLMVAHSEDSGATWSAPQPLRIDADVNDDGLVTAADSAAVKAGNGQRCQTAGYQPALDVNVDCAVNSRDSGIVQRLVGTSFPDTLPKVHQGASLAIAPSTGALYLAWRQFHFQTDPDAIYAARSTDGGVTFSSPALVSPLNPFDQGTSTTSFRTNAYPSLTVDGDGRGYLAFVTRGLAEDRDPIEGDARVVVTTSPDGLGWTPPAPVDNHVERGHQFMPSITFAAGHLQLLYYDQREDLSRVYSRFVDESQILGGPPPRVRHTTEVWAATATPGPSPLFTSVRVTDYLFGVTPGQSQLSQLQYDPPNLPLFRGGTTPFAGDYIDVFPSQPIVTIGSSSFFNTAPTVSPLFHAVWTDNRDVRPPADGDWTRYTPPVPSFPRPTVSGFDPALAIPVPDCEPGFVATRNQNVYTAQVSSGLIAAALTNAKQLGTIQRSFPIYAQNTTSVRRSYRISIRTQPVGGAASLQQFASLTSLDVSVPSRSSVARTVYVTSTDPRASVPIDVVEITAPGGGPIAGGQSAVIILNPDPTNPDVENPDVENPDVENPDVENPDVENVEVYNPDVENPAVLGLANPDVENPDVENPDVENTLVLNPAIVTPDVENPDVENPDVENPDVENPDVENLDLINGGLTDTTWTLTNRGNTAASYSLKMLLNRGFPVGFHSQLLVHRVYRTPAVQGCELKQQTQNILLVNLPDPSFTKLTATTAAQAAGSRLASAAASALEPGVEDPDIDNVTFAIPPGESIVVTLRVYDPNRTDAVTFDAAAAVTPAMIAQAVETEAVANGETTPEVAAPLLPEATPPAAPAGATYSYTLPSIGTGTWSVAGGALPTGLTLNPTTGEISGVATVGGTFSFVALFVRDDGLGDYQTVTITVAGASAFADLAVTTVPTPSPGTAGSPMTYLTTVNNAGPSAASGVTLTQSLPLNVTALSVTPSQGSCTVTSIVQCNLGTIANGAFATVTLNLTPGASGFAQTTATVASATGDVVVANNGATVSTLIQAFAPCATPTLRGPYSFPVPDPARGNVVLWAEDVNRDGDVDAIMSHGNSAHISVLLGDGTGSFGPPSLIAGPAGLSGLAVADFNEDGNLDIVAASFSQADLRLYFGNGDGTFVTPAALIPAFNASVVDPGDFNNDGNVDLIVGGSGNGQRGFLAGRGDGTFEPIDSQPIGTGNVQSVLEDFNRDGNLDLAESGPGIGPAGSIRLYLGNGAGGFTPGTTVTVGTNAGVRQGLGDVNVDGNPDLAVTTGAGGTTNAQTWILFGDGAGGFAPPLDINSGPYSQYTSAADLTGDGLPDVVTVHPLAGGLSVQVGAGTSFGPPIMFAVQEATHLRLTDINHDNRPDVMLISTDEPPSLHVMINTCGQPPADLVLTASDSPDPVAPGAELTYTIAVRNDGPNPATGVLVSVASDVNGLDLLSIDTSFGACGLGSSGIACDFGMLNVGQTETLTVKVFSTAGGSVIPLTTAATANEADPDTTNNRALLTTNVSIAPLTFAVTSTADDFSLGTLRRAIDDANLNAGPDTIEFNIGGGGPQTIQLLSPLPAINGPITIDGTTQPGWSIHNPVIELNGAAAGGTNNGLTINGGGTTIRGLIINRFPGNGIFISGPGGTVIEGNIIGTNLAGAAGIGNAFAGVFAQAPTTIGGLSPGARNVISGNGQNGISISAQVIGGTTLGSSGAGSIILNNYIGTNPAGAAAVASLNNAAGINVRVPNVTIGAPLAGNVIAGNGLAGNNGWGILALATTTTSGPVAVLSAPTGLLVQSNLIGTNATGSAAIPNTTGISINAGSGRVGGTGAGQGNVISGNTGAGLFLTFQTAAGSVLTQSSNVIVEGNLIGLDGTGTTALPNGTFSGQPGVSIVSSNHTIGGTTTAARNVISGNGNAGGGTGISISTNATASPPVVGSNNIIVGNYIGLNAAGNAAIANRGTGITINGNGNAIGGDAAGAGNVISGNLLSGISMNGGTGTVIKGNRVGTNPAGTAAIGNLSHAITINNSNNNIIGGATVGARNLLSGNGVNTGFGHNGLVINNGTGNQVLGNYIGTDVTGTSAIPNTAHGIGVFSGAVGTIIGGVNAGEGNLISGNGVAPVFGSGIQLGGGSGSIVRGNLIGTNAAGTAAIPNRTAGVGITANNNIVGGTTAAARNVISGNGIGAVFAPGVQIFQTGSGNQVLGNYIGTDVTATVSLPNSSTGVHISDTAANNQIGDDVAGAGNIISGNGNNGQFAAGINFNGGSANVVQGNFIGTNAAGTAAVPNSNGGVNLSNTSDNVIGGTTAAARNVISGNGVGTTFAAGVSIFNASSNNQVLGNYIGTNAAGTAIVANTSSGVQISGSGTGNVVGGAAVGAGNLISGNGKNGQFASGVHILDVSGTIVQGNFIGTNAAGTAALPNANGGVDLNNSDNNVIGGAGAGERNLISGNGSAAGAPGNEGQGILINNTSTNNQILGNLIGTDVTGTLAVPNAEGVQLSGDSGSNVVGGTAAGQANTIAFNAGRGIIMFPGAAVGNRFSGNVIHSNTGLGIDLGGGGPDPNDADDVDTGVENDKQNSPVITSATTVGAQTTIVGSLDSTANTQFTVELFSNTICDPSTRGEGKTLIGTISVTTNGSGDATINVVLPVGTAGLFITGTATNPGNSTSEFSNCVAVVP